MNNVKKAAARTKKFVEDHKVAIAVVATALTGRMLNRMLIREYDDFLDDRGLKDEFQNRFNEI